MIKGVIFDLDDTLTVHEKIYNIEYINIAKKISEKIIDKNILELIIDKIDKVNHENLPTILMGDFNSMPKSQPIKKIKSKLFDGLDISVKELNGPIGTYNAFNTDLPIEKRIDYIFVNDFKVDAYTHINDRLNDNRHISDHLPVLIKVQ